MTAVTAAPHTLVRFLGHEKVTVADDGKVEVRDRRGLTWTLRHWPDTDRVTAFIAPGDRGHGAHASFERATFDECFNAPPRMNPEDF